MLMLHCNIMHSILGPSQSPATLVVLPLPSSLPATLAAVTIAHRADDCCCQQQRWAMATAAEAMTAARVMLISVLNSRASSVVDVKDINQL
jgi:hypothetical protein